MAFDPSVGGFVAKAGATQGRGEREGSVGINFPDPPNLFAKPPGVPWRSPVGPSVVRKAGNLARAAIGHLRDGLRRVSAEVKARRLAICRACVGSHGGMDGGMGIIESGSNGPGYFDEHRGVCLHPSCGCPVERKAGLASEGCPIGKWTAEREVEGNS